MQLLLVAPVTKFLTTRSEPGSPRGRMRERRAEASMVKGDGAVEEVVVGLVVEPVVTAGGVVGVEVVIGVIGVDTEEAVGVGKENLMRKERTDHAEGN